MKTRENKAMRFASVLLVLTLLATSLTAGTFAKYTTDAKGEGKARVAKFGVDVSVDTSKLFGEKYGEKDAIVTEGENGVTVAVDTKGTNVVAPGTSGSMTFTIDGNPETKVNLAVKMTDMSEKTSDGNDTPIKEVQLVAGTYKNGNDPASKQVELTDDYYPVKWTLKKSTQNNQEGTPVDGLENKKLSEIETYLEGKQFSKGYDPKSLDDVAGTYTLSWKWDFDTTDQAGTNDGADTILGDLATGAKDIVTVNQGAIGPAIGIDAYSLEEEFKLTISVTQVD